LFDNSQAGRPRIALEFAADRVVAARANDSHTALESFSVRRLPAGSLTPGFTGNNITLAEAVDQAVTAALESVGAQRGEVIVLLPDLAARLLLLDFEQLPAYLPDAESIVRFRLKKALPFDVEQAAVSFETRRNGTAHVLAAVSPRDVLAEYETVMRNAGYAPGVVLPSLLGALEVLENDRAIMLVKNDPGVTSVVIADHGSVALVRTLEHPGQPDFTLSELTESVHPSMVYFEDNYGSKVEQIVVSGMDAAVLAAGLHAEFNVPAEEIGYGRGFGEPMGESAARFVLAPLAGALIG